MASNSRTPPAASGSPASQTENIDIRVPKNHNKRYAIMRFLDSAGVDFTKWVTPKIERENNQVQMKNWNEDMPKFGAGSEYGREAREEARRKKFGVYSKKYKPEDQPWLLQHGGKTGKKYRGVKGGGVTENASYYVFTNAPDGVFEAFPVQDWYNFNPVQSYKALSIEEAEEEFTSRNKTMNLFNVMVRKRMKKNEGDDDDDELEEGADKGKGKKKKASKKRFDNDMDEMMDSSAGESSEGGNSDEGGDEDGKKKVKKGKKPVKPKKKRKQNSDDENPQEDSDDGDDEGRECDYISSSSEADSDVETKNELKGVAEEDALRKMLNSDGSSEDEEDKKDENKEEDNDEAEEKEGEGKVPKEEKEDKKKKKKKNKPSRKEDYGSSSDSGDSSGSELEKTKPSPKIKSNSASSSRSATPTKLVAAIPDTSSEIKKKTVVETPAQQPSKKPRIDTPGSSASAAGSSSASLASSSGNEGVNEESIRRYLSRKPMTTTELLQKFKSKKTGLSSDQLVSHIAQILKKINPVKKMVNGKMFLSIKG